jgi:NAD+ kinase
MVKIVTCTGNFRKKQFFKVIDKIANFFENKKNYVILLTDEFKGIDLDLDINDKIEIDTFENCVSKSDYIFSIGGDGTILSTVRKLGSKQIPVLGIHIGSLGFLAQTTDKNLNKALDCIIKDNYSIDKRIILSVQINNNKTFFALNDAVVDRGSSGRILKSRLTIDEKHSNNYTSDGIIISTPTGSTGYSLSSGGPIIMPELDVFTITPISSHSLSARPIVISAKSFIKIGFTDNFEGAALTIDGQQRIELKRSDIISIRKSSHYANLLMLPFNDYIATLKEKLYWSGASKKD